MLFNSYNSNTEIFTISVASGIKFAANKTYSLICVQNTEHSGVQHEYIYLDSSSEELTIENIAQKPWLIYGYFNGTESKQNSTETTSFFTEVSMEPYDPDISGEIPYDPDSCITTAGQNISPFFDAIYSGLNYDEETDMYNHSVTFRSMCPFKAGSWYIYYIPMDNNPGSNVQPYNEYGNKITENGVYFAEDVELQGWNRIEVAVGQSGNYLVWDYGTFSPQVDTSSPTISFNNEFPGMVQLMCINIEDSSSYQSGFPTANSWLSWGMCSSRFSVNPSIYEDVSDVVFGAISQNNNTYQSYSYYTDEESDYVSTTSFTPHMTSQSAVFRAGRTYDWQVIWYVAGIN